MTELDFEELDKAVSNLMKDVETPSSEDQPASHTVKPPAKLSVQSSQPASLAAKRRGKFMDVMRSPTSSTEVSKLVKRQGVALQPLSDDSGRYENAPNAIGGTTLEDNSAVESEENKEETKDESYKPTRPDTSYLNTLNFEVDREETSDITKKHASPLNNLSAVPMDLQHSKPKVALDEAKQDAEFTPELDLVTSDPKEKKEDIDEPEPSLSSPFLTDTKVDKRPLGNSTISESSDYALAPEETEVHKTPMPDMGGLPEELSSEVMRVESGAASVDAHEPESKTPESKVHEEYDGHAPEDPEPAVEPVNPTVDTPAGGSIAHQYKENAPKASESEESVAIYDTASYHQPLAHPAKRKSGIAIVLWILGIAIVGVLAGVAAFYFVIR